MDRVDRPTSGGCQCGAVRYHATVMFANAHLCHCRMCQKAVGNIFAALVATPDDALTFTRGAPAVWRSSEHVERGFCAACGTPLFYRDREAGRTNLTLGSLDEPDVFPPDANVSTESRMSWFETITGLEDTGPTENDGKAWAEAIAASNRQHPDRDTEEWTPAS